MRFRTRLFVLPLLFVAACSSDHPLAGTWHAEAPPAPVAKLAIAFDGASAKVLVHIDDPDHRHVDGTYTYDPASKAVTVKCKLLGDGKADTWTGTLAGASLELTGGAVKLKVNKGGSAHH